MVQINNLKKQTDTKKLPISYKIIESSTKQTA